MSSYPQYIFYVMKYFILTTNPIISITKFCIPSARVNFHANNNVSNYCAQLGAQNIRFFFENFAPQAEYCSLEYFRPLCQIWAKSVKCLIPEHEVCMEKIAKMYGEKHRFRTESMARGPNVARQLIFCGPRSRFDIYVPVLKTSSCYNSSHASKLYFWTNFIIDPEECSFWSNFVMAINN